MCTSEGKHYFVIYPFTEPISPFGQHRSNHHYTGWKHFPRPMLSGAGRWMGSMEWCGKVKCTFQTGRTLRINPTCGVSVCWCLWKYTLARTYASLHIVSISFHPSVHSTKHTRIDRTKMYIDSIIFAKNFF